MAALNAAQPGASRFVGGCVRNALLGQAADDIDIATQLTPERVMAAAAAAGLQVVPTGIEHGTVTVIAAGAPFEVTTLRRDVSTDGRRATVAFTTDWAEDAARRDFTLNALYADQEGTIHDPTGKGVADALAGRVVFIGDADRRIAEDYLRVLRFFRFSARYAKAGLDAEGLSACGRSAEGLRQISAERVWKELKKLLSADDPRAALVGMQSSGVAAAIWPEAGRIDRLHAMIDLEAGAFLAPDPLQRIAAALPDQTAAGALCQRLKASNDERERLVAAHSNAGRIVCYLSMRELRRLVYRLGQQAFIDQAKIAWADDPRERTTPQWRALIAFAQGWKPPHFPLTGEQVMAAGVPPGPQLGAVMREVEAWWIDADFIDDPLSLAERLKAVVQGMT
jgi:poly(A) polymerase